MASIRPAIRKLPPQAAIAILKKGFVLPAPAARLLFKDILRPEKWHRKWIRKVRYSVGWWGAWLGEKVYKLDDEALLERIHSADLILFHVHGGGFRIGKCTMFMDTYVQLLRVLKEKYNIDALIMSAEHRLSPEYKYPAPLEDVVRAYEHLITHLKVDPKKVVALGDSTGAAMILEMLFITHDPSMFEITTNYPEGQTADPVPELPRPAALVMSSPLVTERTDSNSWMENTKYDYITQYTAKLIIKDFFESPGKNMLPDATQHLGVARLQSGYRAFLPQTLMFVGNKEVLRDDALEIAYKAEQDGVPVETVIEDCVHDWFFVREIVKDKDIIKRADETFAEFCYRTAVAPRRLSNDNVSYCPISEGLAAVPEENDGEEESDDSYYEEFHDASNIDLEFADSSSMSAVTTDMESFSTQDKSSSKRTTLSDPKSSSKRTMTIYV